MTEHTESKTPMSEDDHTLTGGWRPDEGSSLGEDSAYDAVMTRVK